MISMNNVINDFLLVGDKSMPANHLRQPRYTYSACELFTKNKEQIQKFKKLVIKGILSKMNCIKYVFSMIWLKEILKI